MGAPYRIRIVSDLHVGSRWGLWPPGFNYDDEVYPQNRFNRWLWQCWEAMVREHPPVDLLIANGDVRDGEAPADAGAGVKSTELDVQQVACVEVLRPAVKRATEWVLVRGTPYHERWFAGIASALGARKWAGGALSGQVADLEVKGTTHRLNVAHHPEGGRGAIYRGTVLDRTVLWSIISGALRKAHDCSIIVRSHWHHYDCLQANGRTIIHTPGWQLQTPHMKKHAYFRYKPDIGFVDMLLAPDEPYPTVMPVLYPYPLDPTMRIGG